MRLHLLSLTAALLIGIVSLTTKVLHAAPFVPTRVAQAVAISADGMLAATGKSGLSSGADPPRPHSNYRKCAVLQVWSLSSGEMLQRIETFGDILRIALSRDGKRLVSARIFQMPDGSPMNEVCVWDIATRKVVHRFNGCWNFALSPVGDRIAVLSRSKCVLYDTQNFKRLKELSHFRNAVAIEYAPGGKLLAGVVPDGGLHTLKVGDTNGRLLRQSPPLAAAFYSLAFAPDGRELASGHRGGRVFVWNTADIKPIQPLPSFLPSRRLETGGRGFTQPFYSATRIGAGDQTTGDCTFWDRTTGEQLARYTFQRGSFKTHFAPKDKPSPAQSPRRYTFTPDGQAFLAGCHGGMLRAATDGSQLLHLKD